MNEEVKPDLIKPTPMRKLVGLYVAVLLAVFLLGLVPMWLKARASNSRLAQARHQLTLVGMQNNLATAVIDARRGDYEPARSAFTAAQRETAKSLFSRRDEIITSLARGDAVSVDQLSDLYVSYRKNINGE